jgi:hypothetical protein
MEKRFLQLSSRKGPVGVATVADDSLTEEVLAKQNWCLNRGGYPVATVGKAVAYLHVMVYQFYYGNAPDGTEIDHKDRNKLNALPGNLRAVTRSVNIANSAKRMSNKSGYKGVSWDEPNGKWRASITVSYRSINLGRYGSKGEAAKAVNAAYEKYFPAVDVPNEVP